MGIEGSRVGVVGGSIAGCAAAVALRRVGCEVTVYERSRGELKDRGFGIAIPVPLREQLISAAYLDSAMPVCQWSERVWMLRDGDAGKGRVIWRQPSSAVANNWGVLWRTLRAKVPDDSYQEGAAIAGVQPDADGATIVLESGAAERFDLVVGADGYRSKVRSVIHSGSRPAYAGYVLWRGHYEETWLRDLGPLEIVEGKAMTVCFPGGHAVFYLIPGFDYRADPGHRRMNWAMYSQAPAGIRFDNPGSMPPGSVGGDLAAFFEQLLDVHFPPYWAEVVRRTDSCVLSIQPIYDQAIPTYVSGRVLLIGDASTVARPHTGSGATKALQDALALEQVCREHETWDEALAAYDRQRCTAGNELVELGRRIGRDQVEKTPDWASMTPQDFDVWTATTLAGNPLYFYGNVRDGAETEAGAGATVAA
jgi:2-polyprenyl-6-methoxyphenol hydroxylase-like FAD-dependent oxidoreductase